MQPENIKEIIVRNMGIGGTADGNEVWPTGEDQAAEAIAALCNKETKEICQAIAALRRVDVIAIGQAILKQSYEYIGSAFRTNVVRTEVIKQIFKDAGYELPAEVIPF